MGDNDAEIESELSKIINTTTASEGEQDNS